MKNMEEMNKTVQVTNKSIDYTIPKAILVMLDFFAFVVAFCMFVYIQQHLPYWERAVSIIEKLDIDAQLGLGLIMCMIAIPVYFARKLIIYIIGLLYVKLKKEKK